MVASSRTTVTKVGTISVVNFVDAAITDMLQIQQIAQEIDLLVTKEDRRRIILDFSSVNFLSSQTLGMLLKLHRKLADNSGWLGLCGLKKNLHKVFQITRLDTIFNFYDTQQEAADSALSLTNWTKNE